MSTSETGRHGRDLVEQELTRRGWSARQAPVGGRTELVAECDGLERQIRVSTRRRGDWQTSTKFAAQSAPPETRGRFWVFVDLGGAEPDFFVVPESWMVEDIWRKHQEYLERHGGERAVNRDSDHHAIHPRRIAQWAGRWDLMQDAAPGSQPT